LSTGSLRETWQIGPQTRHQKEPQARCISIAGYVAYRPVQRTGRGGGASQCQSPSPDAFALRLAAPGFVVKARFVLITTMASAPPGIGRHTPVLAQIIYNAPARLISAEGANVANVFLLFAFLCLIANFLFSTANLMVADGPNWGSEVCSAARTFCNNPQQLIYAAIVLACIWLLMKFVSAVRY
jgi:hypothetical protein